LDLLLRRPGKFLKAGGAGLNILRQAGRFATKPDFYTGPSGQAGRAFRLKLLF
jgi:hypothetical protein